MEILEGKVLLWLESARFVKNKSGIYVLYDKKLNVLYIGQSDSLQKEFEKYVDTDFENDECKQKTHTYQRSFIVTLTNSTIYMILVFMYHHCILTWKFLKERFSCGLIVQDL